METGEYYEGDVQRFFQGHVRELDLYRKLAERLDRLLPQMTVKVQKSQISFYGRHLFGAASLPLRRKKGWPEHCLLVTFGLPARVESPRIAVAVEPYPNRWTHHVLVTREEELDGELLGWLEEAYGFAQTKGRQARKGG